MRRLMTVAWLACLLATGAAPVTAQSGSAEQEAGDRTVEVSGTGASVTLPAGWRLWSVETESGIDIWATHIPLRQMCRIFSIEGMASPEEAAEDDWGDVHPDVEILERAGMDLPVGDAVRVFWRYKGAPSGFSDYYVAVPLGVALVSCVGHEQPEDHWLHIVESIEALPEGGLPPITFDPRVEVPDPGFAVAFPSHWLVRPQQGMPGPVLGGGTVLRAVTLAEKGGTDAYECWIEDGTGLPGFSDPTEMPDRLEARLGPATEQPVVTDKDSTIGPGARFDGEWNGQLASAWPFTDGDRRIVLFCRSDVPPDDRWASIAETFEFLPEP